MVKFGEDGMLYVGVCQNVLTLPQTFIVRHIHCTWGEQKKEGE